MELNNTLKPFLWKLSFLLLIPFLSVAQTGDDLANVRYDVSNLENGSGHIDLRIDWVVANSNHDYLKQADIDVSIDGGSYVPFAFVGNQEYFNSTSYQSTYPTHDGVDSHLWGELFYIYFVDTDGEIGENKVGYNSSKGGSPETSTLFLGIDVHDISRFSNAKTIQFRVRGEYRRNWFDGGGFFSGGDFVTVNNTYSGEIDISLDTQPSLGNEEIRVSFENNNIDSSDGNITIGMNLEYFDHLEQYDHIDGVNIDYSTNDGASWTGFGYLRHAGLNTSVNPWSHVIDLNDTSKNKDPYKLFFANDENEVSDGIVTYSVNNASHVVNADVTNPSNRLSIVVPVKNIPRLATADVLKWRVRGANRDRYNKEATKVTISDELSENYTITEENGNGQDEIDFNASYNVNEGCAVLTFRLEKREGENVYDHLACLELGKQRSGQADELVGYINHRSSVLGCDDLIENPISSAVFVGGSGDTYKFGMKYSNLVVQQYGEDFYYDSSGDKIVVIKDYITQEEFDTNIKYYVHGSYYERDLGGEGEKVAFNWTNNVRGDFTASSEMNIPAIGVNSVAVSGSSNCQIDVTWDAPASYGGLVSKNYVGVYRNNVLVAHVDADGGANEYLDTDVVAGETYNYQLALVYGRDFDTNLEGQKSSSKSGTIALLEAPSGLTSSQTGCDGSIDIAWTYASNPAGFVLERKTENTSFEVLDAAIDGSLRMYTDNNNIVENEVYYYRISAIANALVCSAQGEFSAVLTHSKDPIDVTPIFNTSNYRVEASKGYFSNRTELEWSPNLDTEQYINQYKIYTREFGTTTAPKLLTTLDINAKRYDHTDGNAGTIYEYFIVGERVVETDCGRQITSSYAIDGLTGIETPSNLDNGVAYDVGLRVATGVINGNIVYKGGTSVPNVKVVAERQDNNLGKSLYFNGTDAYTEVADNEKLVPKSGNITLSGWIKPENLNQFSVVIEKQVSYGVHIAVDGSTYFYIKDQNNVEHSAIAPAGSFVAGNWTNITGTFNKETQELSVYINGALQETKVLSGVTGFNEHNEAPLVFGRQHFSQAYYFQGNVDEVRLYNKALSAEEVAKESSKLIAADVDGLNGYWKVFEGAGSKVYDLAHEGEDFYKNDAVLVNALFASDTPTQTQLGNVGYTDEYGNYTIEAVEYANVGENFNIIPTATLAGAVHEFDPARKTLFIGEGSKVNNDKDFEDISSFQYSGYVYFDFENTEGGGFKSSGSEGVKLYLDGNIAITGDDNKVYETGADGFFDVQIPIGQHFVEFRKNKHTFKDDGRFPASGTHDFQEGITGLEVWDETTFVLSGKIAGGTVEQNKNLFMDHEPGVNNIGQGVFTLTSEDTKVVRQVFSDPVTGEYTINLPPKKYTSSSVDYTGVDTDANPIAGTIVSSGDINPLNLTTITAYNGFHETDSVFVADVFTKIDSTFYNLRKDFILRETPELIVSTLEGDGLENSGELFYELDQGDNVINVSLSNLRYPVYKSAIDYSYKMKAVEKYINKNTAVEDVVAVTDGDLTINNNIGQGYYINDQEEKIPYASTGNPEQMSLDDNGELLYLFKTSEPNTTRNQSAGQEHLSFTKSMSINLTVNGITTAWSNPLDSGEPFLAYVLGGAPDNGGNTFVTQAPATVDFVLRDPGGSNSYAYWTKGETNTTTQEFYVGGFANLNAHLGIGAGFNTLVGGGIVGVGETAKGKILGTIDVNVSAEVGGGGEFSQTYSFDQTITTNGDPIQIGRSDVYVASSKNMSVGTALHIRPIPINDCGGQCYGDVMTDDDGNQYKMTGVKEMYMNPIGTPTYFIYSENHIVNVLIPDLEEIRNTFFTSDPLYTSKLAPDHANYGTNNDSPVWSGNGQTSINYVKTEAADFDGPSYTFTWGNDDTAVDEVRKINTQIRLWKEALANNEIAKWLAEKNQTAENISISGGNTIERSMTNTDSKYGYGSFETSASIALGVDIEYTGWGVGLETSLSAEVGIKTSGKFGGGKETTKTTGFVLADSDEDDFLSIDVYEGDGGNGPIFKTIGGQTSCPFEDKVIMKYTTSHHLDAILLAMQADIDRLTKEIAGIDTAILITEALPASPITTATLVGLSAARLSKNNEKNGTIADRAKMTTLKSDFESREIVLSNRTIQRDRPELLINGAKTAQAFNVPADEAANFNLTLNNLSESGDPMFYAVQALDETNPNGLEMTVDGQSINSSREFLVQGDGGINKVLKVRRGPNHYDYDNVGIIIKSTCQFDPTGNDAVISDTIYFAAKFLPICTPLEIKTPSNNWTLNNSFNNIQPITVAGYDVNTVGFEEIKLQYKESSSADWILLSTYYKDETVRTDKGGSVADPLLPTSGNTLTYNWDLGVLPDGNYDIRALSGCALAESETEIYSGIVDRTNPEPFGAPQPSDGILSAGEEASIQFTEMINANLLSAANFDIRGVLNAGDVRHDASVAFAGSTSSNVKVESVNMANKAFSIEFYAKKSVSGVDQVMIGQGTDPLTEMLLGINASNNFYFKLANRTVTGSMNIDNNWHHYTVTYNPLTTDVSLYVDATLDGIDNSFAVVNRLKEDIYFGTAAASKSFTGNMHEVRFWTRALTVGQVNISAVTRMVGNEAGLLYNWELEEVHGDLAIDKVRAKNAVMNATWSVDPVGYGLALNGTNNQALLNTTIAFDNKSDFTLSFWFKSNGSGDQVLLSNGKGDGIDANASGWSIGINNSGNVYVFANGEQIVGSANVLDAGWHHISVVTSALGNAVLYLDALEQGAMESSKLSGFGGSRLALGQRVYESGANLFQDKYFSGNIDEVRFWNVARTLDQVSRDRYNQLSGDEPGLVAYYPFETYTENAGLYTVTSDNVNQATSSSKVTETVDLAGGTLTQVTPTIKLKRPIQKINFSYVVNNDKVILTLNADSGSIENVLLDFTANGIKDMNGNTIDSPITWSAYVDKNQVVWQDNSFDLETSSGEELNFESKIFNNSGESKSYTISNIPSWLEVSPVSGTVGPLTSIPISFKVTGDVNNGIYNQVLLLATDFGFSETLDVTVAVQESLPENWKVSPSDFEFSMNVVGQLSFDGVLSRDEGNVLGAFVGNECRGLINLRYLSTFDNYQAFLPVYSNQASGETLEFKIWEASTGIIHSDITHDMSSDEFVPNLFEGTPSNPKIFSISNSVSGNVALASGWRWVSFNLTGDDLTSTNNLLDNLNPTDGDIIKTRVNKDNGGGSYLQTTMVDAYNASTGDWEGTISAFGTIETGILYKIKTTTAEDIYYEGVLEDPLSKSIHLVTGWNYLGYLGVQKIPVNEGLSNLVATDGDLIKGQKFSAIYDSNYGWIGSLTVLSPNEGYMIYTAVEQDFNYPAFNSTSGVTSRAKEVSTAIKAPWVDSSANFSDNMMVVARINNGSANNGVLGVFVNNECRGVANITYNPVLEEDVYFVNVAGDIEGEELTFKYYDAMDSEIYEIKDVISYGTEKVIGSISEPLELTMLTSSHVEIKENVISPNPFTEKTRLQFNASKDENVIVKVYNSSGAFVVAKNYLITKEGLNSVEFYRGDLASGIYFMIINTQDKSYYTKIVIVD